MINVVIPSNHNIKSGVGCVSLWHMCVYAAMDMEETSCVEIEHCIAAE